MRTAGEITKNLLKYTGRKGNTALVEGLQQKCRDQGEVTRATLDSYEEIIKSPKQQDEQIQQLKSQNTELKEKLKTIFDTDGITNNAESIANNL